MSQSLFLVGHVGSNSVAIPADRVEAVLRIDAVVPVPGAPAMVRGLVSIRSRVLVLIDSAMVAGEEVDAPANYMAIVGLGGHSYALALDGVHDVVELHGFTPIPAAMTAGWQKIASQVVDHGGDLILEIDLDRLVEAAGRLLAA
jgi:purine-binding chemotaxis protein CheW